MKEKQPLFILALKQNKKYGSETKQKKNSVAQQSEKKNTEA
jgi:hypothetical protein